MEQANFTGRHAAEDPKPCRRPVAAVFTDNYFVTWLRWIDITNRQVSAARGPRVVEGGKACQQLWGLAGNNAVDFDSVTRLLALPPAEARHRLSNNQIAGPGPLDVPGCGNHISPLA